MALTFDDGPSPYNTPSVLSTLAQYGIKATFFLVGVNVQSFPALARRMVGDALVQLRRGSAGKGQHHQGLGNLLQLDWRIPQTLRHIRQRRPCVQRRQYPSRPLPGALQAFQGKIVLLAAGLFGQQVGENSDPRQSGPAEPAGGPGGLFGHAPVKPGTAGRAFGHGLHFVAEPL